MRRDPTPQTIGNRLREAREAREIRPERLAADLEISVDTLKRYELGTTEPSYRQVVHAAAILDYPLDWFVQDGAAA